MFKCYRCGTESEKRMCKSCKQKENKTYYLSSKEKQKRSKISGCLICNGKPTEVLLQIDYSSDGTVRGLLCSRCKEFLRVLILNQRGSDIFSNAKNYLKLYQGGPVDHRTEVRERRSDIPVSYNQSVDTKNLQMPIETDDDDEDPDIHWPKE